jgi:hypothetical protein
MELDDATLDFFAGPVLLMVASVDQNRRPAIGRAMGLIVRSADTLDILVSRWQWPRVLDNVAASRRLAVTASRASDYLTYQLKGAASLRESGIEEKNASRRYHDAVRAELGQLNVPVWISGQWSADRDMMAVELRIAEAYVQTPGPLAGTSL